jgi:hypothetical protein
LPARGILFIYAHYETEKELRTTQSSILASVAGKKKREIPISLWKRQEACADFWLFRLQFSSVRNFNPIALSLSR